MPSLWIGFFSAEPVVLAVGEAYSLIVGPTYGLFGVGLALYFASQGSGHVAWALLAGVARLLVTAGGGWIAIHWLGGGLASVFFAVALGFIVFGLGQLAAIPGRCPSLARPLDRLHEQPPDVEAEAGDGRRGSLLHVAQGGKHLTGRQRSRSETVAESGRPD